MILAEALPCEKIHWLRPFPALTRRQAQRNKQRCGSGCALSRRCEKDTIAACDRRILEFPLSMSPKAVAKMLKAEGWYGPKTTVYYIEFRIRRLRGKGHPENAQAEDQNRLALPLGSPPPSSDH